jgi:hypothetical protein
VERVFVDGCVFAFLFTVDFLLRVSVFSNENPFEND